MQPNIRSHAIVCDPLPAPRDPRNFGVFRSTSTRFDSARRNDVNRVDGLAAAALGRRQRRDAQSSDETLRTLSPVGWRGHNADASGIARRLALDATGRRRRVDAAPQATAGASRVGLGAACREDRTRGSGTENYYAAQIRESPFLTTGGAVRHALALCSAA
jgi:hypothetical protein